MNTAKETAETPTFSQAQVELATGFSREVLRKWELRFGFPHPTRDGRERRLYSLSDLQRLQLIKQLLQTGHRPRHLLPLPAEALHHLMASSTEADVATPSPVSKAVLKILTGSPTPADLDTYLRARLDKVGLAAFAVNDLPVLNEAIGNAWANGSLGVHGEHFYTASVRRAVQEKITQLQPPRNAPRVLFSTPYGELHELGILMLHAALASHGAHCIDLGVQTPPESIVKAVLEWDVSVVCISVSVNFSATTALAYVATLRSLLPPNCRLWIGGQGTRPIADAVPLGVSVFDTVHNAIEAWDLVKQTTHGK